MTTISTSMMKMKSGVSTKALFFTHPHLPKMFLSKKIFGTANKKRKVIKDKLIGDQVTNQ